MRIREGKKWHGILVIVIIVATISFQAYAAYWPKRLIVFPDGAAVTVLLADTAKHRYQGWSGRKTMGKYDGMLFVFPERSQHTMVMRGMEFSLDIIWIDGRRIVDLAPNVAPEPGKAESDLMPYFARGESTLVLELPAGFIAAHALKIGDAVVIPDAS